MDLHPALLRHCILTAAIGALFISCGGSEEQPAERGSGTPVQVVHPARRTMTERLSLNGNTMFLKKEIIRSSFDGFVARAFRNIGDAVQPGTEMFRVKTKELAATDSATLRVGNRLFDGAVTIGAGSHGTVTEVDFHEGDYVTAGEQLAIVSNPSSLRIRLNVPYELASAVDGGGGCDIQLPNGAVLPGIIETSVPSVDPATQTQTFLITLRHYQALPENLNVIVTIAVRRTEDAITVPRTCIMTNVTQDEFWIMKLISDTTAVRIPIQTGIENDSVVQILSPLLGQTERVVVHGAYGLPDTANVEIAG
jgi:multidrug efflux pump subunit AcrA (membrane-fusion protein)